MSTDLRKKFWLSRFPVNRPLAESSRLAEVPRGEIRAEKLMPKADTQGSQNQQQAATEPLFEWYDKSDLLGNSLALGMVLERYPRGLRAYFAELAAASDKTAVRLTTELL